MGGGVGSKEAKRIEEKVMGREVEEKEKWEGKRQRRAGGGGEKIGKTRGSVG
jgi:hypothetical protein